MQKKKIVVLLVAATMIATMAGVGASATVNHNINKTTNKVLLSAPAQTDSTGYACVVNGNNKLVLTNKEGQVVSYLSVGEMLKVQKTNGNKTLVTVEETGAKGYIDNSNMLAIQNANINNIIRMNRNGFIINVSSSVNLRQGPGMDHQVIEGLSNNTPVRITGKTGDWYRVSVGGVRGYIFGEYVAESNAKNSIIIPPAVSRTTDHVTQHGNTSTIHNSASSIAPIGEASTNTSNTTPVSTTHVKVVNHDMQPASENHPTVVNHNVQPATSNVVNHNSGNTNVAPIHHEINNGHKSPVINPNGGTKVTPDVAHNSGNTNVTPEHHDSKGTNTPANPSKYKPVPSGVHGKKGDAVHGHEVTPSHVTPDTHNDGGSTIHKGSTNPSTPATHHNSGNTGVTPDTHNDGGSTIHKGSTNPATPVNHDGNKGSDSKGHMSHFTPMNHDGDKGGSTIHKGSTNPSTPVHHNDNKPDVSGNTNVKPAVTPMAAPTLTAHNYKLIIGKTFSNSMLDANANEGATISYEGHVNNMKPGTYPMTVVATNSQGGRTEAKVSVDVVDVAPTINAENYSMTQGGTFSNADLNIKAHSQAGVNLTQDVKVEEIGRAHV